MESVKYIDAGLVPYGECKELQERWFDALVSTKREGLRGGQAVIVCEHPHVYTLGRNGLADNLLIPEEFLRGLGAEFVRTDRGGDITYHGPGQLVGYPILDLERMKMGVKDYVACLEQSVMDTLADYGLESGRIQGATGVWMKGGPLRKIAAIGIRCSNWVTMHGFALNLSTDLEWFGYINPCGFTDRGVTSLERELDREADPGEVKARWKAHFGEIMNIKIE